MRLGFEQRSLGKSRNINRKQVKRLYLRLPWRRCYTTTDKLLNRKPLIRFPQVRVCREHEKSWAKLRAKRKWIVDLPSGLLRALIYRSGVELLDPSLNSPFCPSSRILLRLVIFFFLLLTFSARLLLQVIHFFLPGSGIFSLHTWLINRVRPKKSQNLSP